MAQWGNKIVYTFSFPMENRMEISGLRNGVLH